MLSEIGNAQLNVVCTVLCAYIYAKMSEYAFSSWLSKGVCRCQYVLKFKNSEFDLRGGGGQHFLNNSEISEVQIGPILVMFMFFVQLFSIIETNLSVLFTVQGSNYPQTFYQYLHSTSTTPLHTL